MERSLRRVGKPRCSSNAGGISKTRFARTARGAITRRLPRPENLGNRNAPRLTRDVVQQSGAGQSKDSLKNTSATTASSTRPVNMPQIIPSTLRTATILTPHLNRYANSSDPGCYVVALTPLHGRPSLRMRLTQSLPTIIREG